MNKKTIYESPEVDWIEIFESDIITTSGGGENDVGEDSGENDGEWA